MLDRQTMEIPHWRWESEQQMWTHWSQRYRRVSIVTNRGCTGLVFRTCARTKSFQRLAALERCFKGHGNQSGLRATIEPSSAGWHLSAHFAGLSWWYDMSLPKHGMHRDKIIDTKFPVRNRSNALSFDQPCVTFFSERAALFMSGFKDWRYEMTWNCLESVYFLDRKVHFVGSYRYF